MLNKKIIGLFVLGLALSSPLQSANAASASPGGTDGGSSELTCYEPSKCKPGYGSKGNIRGEQNIGSGDCWCVYSGEILEAMDDYEGLKDHTVDNAGCGIPGECMYKTQAACESVYKYSICDTGSDGILGLGCYAPIVCNSQAGNRMIMGNECGLYESNKIVDDYGCGRCEVECRFGVEKDGIGSYYTDVDECQNSEGTAACKVDTTGCIVPTSCKSGYTIADDGKTCVKSNCADGTYSDNPTCRDAHPGWDCTPNAQGCYAPTGCSIGYEDNTWHIGGVGEDRLGSGVCDCIFYEGIQECENRLGATCTVDKYGCPIPDITTCDYRTGSDFENDPNNRYSTYWNAYFDPNGNNLCVAFDMCDLSNGAKWKDDLTCENGTKDLDANGCGKCVCNDGYKLEDGTCVQDIITYGSITECEAANPGFVCDYYGGGYGDASKWVSTGTCKDGYTLSADGKSCVSSNPCAELGFGDNLYPYDLCVSSCSGSCSTGTPVRYYSTGSGLASCYSCCAYKDQAACEEANSGFACELDANGACYAPTTSCKDGYKLENGACVPQTCDEGTYTTKSECEEKYPGFECGEVGDDSSLGSGAQGHSAGSGN